MKKAIKFILLTTILCSCATFTNDKTYYGTVIFSNSSDSTVSVEITGSSKSAANESTGTSGRNISVNESRELNVSWIPGDYSVIVIDGADQNDSFAQFDYKITSDNTLINNTGWLSFQINKSGALHLSLHKIPIKETYTFIEFNELLTEINLDKDKNTIKSIYYKDEAKKEYTLNSYAFGQNTTEDNIKLFSQIEEILTTNNITQTISYYCIQDKE